MNVKLQVLLAIGLILGAVGVVKVVGGGDDAVVEESAAGGHSTHGAAGGGEPQPVRVSEEAAGRIGMTLATVERRTLDSEVRSVGWVSYDETRLYSVSPKIGGWIEHLWVEFTGAPVKEGEPLLEIYSPELVAAQEELVLATRLMAELSETTGRARQNAEDLLVAARRRLEYWDIPADAIAELEASGEVRKTMVLRAPASGLIVEKKVLEGDKIQAGTTVFRVADLSRIWVEADVFERDLGLLTTGQRVDLTVEAFPGREFAGTITYIYPTVAMGSRTGRIRVELANPGLDLKPGMYADVMVTLPNPGAVLTIPRSSVVTTGERSVVFLRHDDGRLHPTEIQVGRRIGEFIEVIAGLNEGDEVVSSANFLIDSESNLGAAMAGMGMAGMDMGGSDTGGDDMEGMDMGETEDSSADTTMKMEGMDMNPGEANQAARDTGGN
jgi:membrane fusion protein, copper/silver efflux system